MCDIVLKHFNPTEFKCKCGKCDYGIERMNIELLEKLDELRDLVGWPLVISSSIRCPAHNLEVGGKANSAHLKGYAVDIAVASIPRQKKLITEARVLGINRFGIGCTFIHLDIDPSKPSPAEWRY